MVAASLWLAPSALAAGWCGGSVESAADRPDVVTGQQVHAIIAVPSDSPDTFAGRAGQLADDVTSMLTWWQGQDPTRVPRFDQATFGGVNCLDISFVRLPGPASSYSVASSAAALAAFSAVGSQLTAAGFSNPFKKYLVYADGIGRDTDSTCGTGGGDLTQGPAYADVWLGACPRIATDTIATHELLHAFGAVDARDPHCPSDSGHPCDSPTDVLFPTADGTPLSQKVLDFNHDDYYAHNNPWDDIQDSLWLHRLDLPQVALNVSLSGGPGSVRSDVPGLDCAAACTTQWDQGALVSLVAVPANTSRFVHWTGACAGNGDCALTLDQAKSTVAAFGPLRIPLRVSSAGKGRIACTPRCVKSFSAGDALTLRAVPTKGWRFSGWTGGCKGARLICRPKTDYALTVRATFKKR